MRSTNSRQIPRLESIQITIRWLKSGDVLTTSPNLEAAHEHLDLVTCGDFRTATDHFYLELDKGGIAPEPVRPIKALFLAAHERRTQTRLF